MKTIYASGDQVIDLGRQGEDRAVRVLFDLSALKKDHGEGAAVLTLCRAGEGERWLLLPEREEDMAVWVVSGHWTRFAGYGSCQLSWYVDGALAKSVSYPTRVEPALDAGGADTDPDLGFLAQVQQAAGQAVLAAQKAQNVELGLVHQPTVNNGTWWVWDQEGEGYRDTGEPARGPAGVSPLVEVDVSGQDLGITVTDAGGAKHYSFQAATLAQLEGLARAAGAYGIGTLTIQDVPNSNFDSLMANGIYKGLKGNAVGVPDGMGEWCFVLNLNYDDGGLYGVQFALDMNGNTVGQRYKRGGQWNSWEHISPPMVVGVEYRSTQGWQGRTVFTRLVDCGEITSGKTVGIEGLYGTVIRWSGVRGNNVPLPAQSAGLNADDFVEVSIYRVETGEQITIVCSDSNVGQNVTIQLWYVKD